MPNIVSASISGLTTPDETLTASATSVDPDVSFSFQWQSSADSLFDDAVDIGSNSPKYTVAESDLGSVIRVTVIATDTSHNGTPATSAATTLLRRLFGRTPKAAIGAKRAGVSTWFPAPLTTSSSTRQARR